MFQRSVSGTLQLLRPVLNNFRQARNFRPTVRIGKDKFELKVDVHQFTLPEIRVKACPDYVIIEGQQERKVKNGYVVRKFVRKFKLPSGCQPNCIESKLNDKGVLTITSPRCVMDQRYPCEQIVPIKCSGPEQTDDSFIKKDNNPCEIYLKVKQDSPPGDTPKT